MDPIEYFKIVRQRWRVLAAACLIGVLAGFVTSSSKADSPVTGPTTTRFQATHVLMLESDGSESKGAELFNQQNVSTLSLLLKAGKVPEHAAAKLGVPPTEGLELAGEVSSKIDVELGTISITSVQKDGRRAADVANAFAKALVEVLDEREKARAAEKLSVATARLRALEDQINNLDARISAGNQGALLRAQRDAQFRQYSIVFERLQQLSEDPNPTAGLATLQEARPTPASTASRPLSAPSERGSRMAVGGLVGLILGTGLALLLNQLDTSLRSRKQAEKAFGLPVIAEIPHLRGRHHLELATLHPEDGSVAEAYRLLRTALLFRVPIEFPAAPAGLAAAGGASEALERRLDRRVILVVSPGPGEGKTTTAVNFAAVLAESGKSVLVVDFDLRQPRVHEAFGLSPGPGVSDALDPDGSFRLADVVRSTTVPGVDLVMSGTPSENPSQLVSHAASIVAAAREWAEVVVMDAPPLLVTSDASELVPLVDDVLVVARVGKTSEEAAALTCERLARLGAPLLGVLLIGVKVGRSARRYYRRYQAPTVAASDKTPDEKPHSEKDTPPPTVPGKSVGPSMPIGPKLDSGATASRSQRSAASSVQAGERTTHPHKSREATIPTDEGTVTSSGGVGGYSEGYAGGDGGVAPPVEVSASDTGTGADAVAAQARSVSDAAVSADAALVVAVPPSETGCEPTPPVLRHEQRRIGPRPPTRRFWRLLLPSPRQGPVPTPPEPKPERPTTRL